MSAKAIGVIACIFAILVGAMSCAFVLFSTPMTLIAMQPLDRQVVLTASQSGERVQFSAASKLVQRQDFWRFVLSIYDDPPGGADDNPHVKRYCIRLGYLWLLNHGGRGQIEGDCIALYRRGSSDFALSDSIEVGQLHGEIERIAPGILPLNAVEKANKVRGK